MCQTAGRAADAGAWGVVSVFELGVRAGRDAGATRFSAGVADVGPRSLRRSSELGRARACGKTAIGRERHCRPHAERRDEASRADISPADRRRRAFLYGNQPAAWLGNIDVGGVPLSLGLLLLPLSFFVVHLTNRRYGAGYAIAQIIGAWALHSVRSLTRRTVLSMLHNGALPDMRLVLGFGGGLFLAQLVSVFVFDRLRGPQWWQAPLFGRCSAALRCA